MSSADVATGETMMTVVVVEDLQATDDEADNNRKDVEILTGLCGRSFPQWHNPSRLLRSRFLRPLGRLTTHVGDPP